MGLAISFSFLGPQPHGKERGIWQQQHGLGPYRKVQSPKDTPDNLNQDVLIYLNVKGRLATSLLNGAGIGGLPYFIVCSAGLSHL